MDNSFSPTSPHPVTKEQIPITIGHEFSGIVKELGKGVSGLDIGQKVAVQPTIFCASCGACKIGAENACSNGGFIGSVIRRASSFSHLRGSHVVCLRRVPSLRSE